MPSETHPIGGLVVIGSYNRDLMFATDTLPAAGQTRLGRFASAHGGKGFNQAIAACRLGVPTLFAGALGDDSYAADARAFARSEGLACRWQTVTDATGLACVLTDAHGRNQIVVAPGANEALTREHVAAIAPEIGRAPVLLTQLECSLEAIVEGLRIARAAGVATVLNPAPIHGGVTAELIALADAITPNESEFAHLLAQLGRIDLPAGWERAAPEQMHQWCRQTDIGTVVITLGERGCFVSHGANSRFAPEARWESVAASAVTAVDTTGAGDAFNGALCAGLVHFDEDFRGALSLAVRAAGISVTRAGAAPSMPHAHEVGL